MNRQDEKGLSRRRLLGGSAAAGAGALVARVPGVQAAKRRHRRRADVAIVGAGFAGLTAARELVRRGRSVVVLEARNRVGGRVFNHQIGGGEISEAGGTFVGPTQNHVIRLGRELGIDTFPTYHEGENVYLADGSRSTYDPSGPTGEAPPDPLIVADLAEVVARGDLMATEVPVDAPWEAERAAEWDGKTFETWIREGSFSPRFHEIVPVWTRAAFGTEMRDLSLLFVAFYLASSGDERHVGTFERNFNTHDGAQEQRFEGGSQLICLRMARQLGGRVVLGSPVRRIVQDRSGVRVVSKRVNVTAKRVIVAVPPALAVRIDYRPALPAPRDKLMQRVPMGHLIKATAVYRRPFWREKGLTGTFVALDGDGFVQYSVDDSPPSGKPGVLFGFIGGDEAVRFRATSERKRRAAVLEQFAFAFGPEALHPRDYFEMHWPNERWSRGGPVGIMGPGTMLRFGPALRRPVGRIHWAGTETSNYWNGYMDGAVRSGERAAREVLDRL